MFRSKLFAATVLVTATLACAQNQPGGQGPQNQGGPGQGPQGQGQRGPGGMGGPGGQMNFDQMKTTLHASDEEWKVVSPAVRKVVNARRIAEAGLLGAGNGGGGMRRGPGGPGGRGGNDAFGGPNNQRPGGGPMGGQGGPDGGNGGFPPPPPDGNGQPPADAPQVNRDEIPMPGPGGGDQQGGQQGGRRTGGQGGQGGPGGFGGPGGPGGMMGGMGGPTGPVATAMAELKTLADSGTSTADQLAAKVTAVRAAREKARAAVKSAVEELQALVTPEQEAALVGLGVIE